MPVTNVSDAKAQLSALLRRVERGEEIVIGRAGRPVAKLVPFERAAEPRTPGALAGRIELADDFDELPADLAEAFGVPTRDGGLGDQDQGGDREARRPSRAGRGPR